MIKDPETAWSIVDLLKESAVQFGFGTDEAKYRIDAAVFIGKELLRQGIERPEGTVVGPFDETLPE